MESGTGHFSRFEFIVAGTPISSQSANRERLRDWKQSVRQSARAAWSGPLVREPIYLKVTYFYVGFDGGLDNDNILKPIQDALEGVVFEDDHLVHIVTVIRCNLDREFAVPTTSRNVVQALERRRDFVHVVVDRLPAFEDLP